MPENNYHHGDLKNALIQSGIEILSKEGLSGLSLRKVAMRAGVSHSAPYAHFPDKQALVAAISTEGFNQLYEAMDIAVSDYAADPRRQLFEGTRAYVHFALTQPDTFKIMFSSVLEKENNYPAFVDISKKTMAKVVGIVRECQKVHILRAGSPEMLALVVWGQMHGIVSLAMEGQIPHNILDRLSVQEIVSFALEQIILKV